MATPSYTASHARAGLSAPLPTLETWPNQHQGYEITTVVPEFTSICPKTLLPDFGTLTIRYRPRRRCLELKSLKYYLLGYRTLGIFYENAVNRVLDDVVAACRPAWAVVEGAFNTRGGMRSTITARYPRTAPRRRG
ncbi:MAG: NADPH-dependent 7-cyano-7-deazaguanine reductase QueF [Omnitrophica WOR_2 bacterium RIFCSPHIGHO2_02_FULL_68_15]|nr:MAG: NADPH-dependent 7-cyano-7-deazaguanine reductase QueF [Omnitrophica WOR_2 bacterium RIFCSPHIGHO2_02_FULL_68_15]